MSRKKQIFKCSPCDIVFRSQKELQNHAYSRQTVENDTGCINALHRCPFCDELWPTSNSLNRHISSSRSCKRIQKLPDTVSEMKSRFTKSNFEQKKNQYHFNNFQGKNRKNICFPQKTKDSDETFRLSIEEGKDVHFRNNKMKSSFHNGDICKASSLQTNVLHKKEVPLGSNDKEIFYLDITCINKMVSSISSGVDGSREEFFFSVLKNLSDNSDIRVIEGTMKQLAVELKNLCASFQRSDDFIHGNYDFKEVCNEDIISFIEEHFENADEQSIRMQQNEEQDMSFLPQQQQATALYYDVHDNTQNSFDHSTFSHSFDVQNDSDEEENVHSDDDVLFEESLDNTLHHHQEEVNKTRDSSHYDSCEIALLDLYNMLHKAGAPVYLFDQITNWCQRSSSSFMNRRIPSREKFLQSMSEKAFGKRMSRALEPRQTVCTLPSGRTLKVTKFSFIAQVGSILMNDDLMKPENLLLNPCNPFSPPGDSLPLGDINTGWWFSETWRELCIRPNNILLPLIFFLDAGAATKRLNVEPLTFTLGILKRSIRNKEESWRTLGYMESPKNAQEEESSSSVSSLMKLKDYHSVLSVLLDELKLVQGNGSGIKFDLKINGAVHHVVFKVAVQVVLGDCKGQNILCGQKGGHSLLSNKLCRDCHVTPFESDDPDYQCKYVHIDHVKGKSRSELEALSMHKVDNAFEDVYFGARSSSIFDSTPPEPLHGVLLGTVKYMYEVFEELLSSKTINLLNIRMRNIHRIFSSQSIKDMPCLAAFVGGIQKPDVLTAKDQLARVFGIFLSLQDYEVFHSFAHHPKKVRRQDPNTGREVTVQGKPLGRQRAKKWIELIESSLLMYEWLMSEEHSRDVITDQLEPLALHEECVGQSRMRDYMRKYKYLMSTREGHGLKITKFHQLLHYTRYISKYGSVQNFDTGICEGLAVSMYKRHVKSTQRQHHNLNSQIAVRHYYSLMCYEASRIVQSKIGGFKTTHHDSHDQKLVFGGTRFSLQFYEDHDSISPFGELKVQWHSSTKNDLRFDEELLLSMAERLFLNTDHGGNLTPSSIVSGYTEFTDENNNLYRAHPNFKGKGEWYDWCLVNWEDFDEPVPAKIMTFLNLEECSIMSGSQQCEMMAWLNDEDSFSSHSSSCTTRMPYLTLDKWVVLRCGITEDEAESMDDVTVSSTNLRSRGPVHIPCMITKRFFMEEGLRLLPLDSIAGPCFCVPSSMTMDGSTNSKEYIQILQRSEWSRKFLET